MKNTSFARSRGFTLIELMVGLVVGLVVLLAVTQVYVNWEGRQRTSSSKNDAQISGTLAAYNLERDLRQAGVGFGSANSTLTIPGNSKLGCALSETIGGKAVAFNFTPIQIVNGVDGAPDQISVVYGNSSTHSLTVLVDNPVAATAKHLRDSAGFVVDDRVVLTTAANTCRMVTVTANNAATRTFQHTGEDTGATVFDQAFNLGPEPTATVWRIGATTSTRPVLEKTNLLPVAGSIPAALDIAEGIVNLQAQYGYDVNGDGQIAADEWFDAGDAALAAMEWNRVLAVRYAVLARSRHYDGLLLATNPATPSWAAGQFVMTDISGAADSGGVVGGENNWRGYRHVVYEGVVSLRNVLWGRQL